MSAPPSNDARAPSSTTVALLVALLCLVWGSTWIVIAGGLRDLPPFTSAATRFAVAAACLTAIAPALARREGGSKPTFALSAAVGTLNFGASYAIVYWSETRLPSGLASVLWSVFPLLMAVAGAWFLQGEKLTARQGFGFVLGFAGVALLFATDLVQMSNDAVGTGVVLLASPVVSCVGTVVLKKHGRHVSSVLVNRDAMWIGAALLAVLALAFEREAPVEWTARAVASVAYLALIGTVLTFTLYFWLLRHVAAYRLSMIAYVTPALALTLGTLFGREPLTAWTVAGSGTILLGVALVVAKRRPPAASDADQRAVKR